MTAMGSVHVRMGTLVLIVVNATDCLTFMTVQPSRVCHVLIIYAVTVESAYRKQQDIRVVATKVLLDRTVLTCL